MNVYTARLMETWSLIFVLVLVRVGFFVAFFPLFRSVRIPRLVKLALVGALCVTCITTYFANSQMTSVQDLSANRWLELGIAVSKEGIIGSFIGFSLGMFFLPARVAGTYIGQEMGLNLGSMSDPSAETPANPIGDLTHTLGLLLFLALDLHLLSIGALYQSFIYFPIGTELDPSHIPGLATGICEALRWGLQLAAPVGVCLFLTTVIILLIMRVAPQLNLFTIGMPLRLAVGLATTIFFLPEIVGLLHHVFGHFRTFVLIRGM